MNKKTFQVILLALAVAIPTVGFAEDSNGLKSSSVGVRPHATATRIIINKEAIKARQEERKENREEIKDIKIQSKSSVKDVRIGARENIKDERKEFHGEVKNIRATTSLSIEEKRHKIESDWEKKRDELEKMREEREKKIEGIRQDTHKIILNKREELKIELKKINDERKVKIVEATDRKLEKINNDRTNHLLDVLNHLEKALAKIKIRINEAKERGVDVSSAQKAAEDAERAIVAARAAVETQAAKIYKMTITEENKLKIDVGNTVHKLESDLKQVRIIVQSAHDSVRKAAVALAKSFGLEDETRNHSSSSVASASSSSVAISSSSSVSSAASSSMASSISNSSSSVVSSSSSSSIVSSSSASSL